MKKLIATGMLVSAAFFGAINPTMAQSTKTEAGIQQTAPINLNTATLEQLTRLKGIGQSKAQAILEYRQTIGEFHHIEQLAEVKGIGSKMVEKLAQQITVN